MAVLRRLSKLFLVSLSALLAGVVVAVSINLFAGGSTSGAPLRDTVVTIGATESVSGGVTVAVNRVEQSPEGLVVSYTATSSSKYLGEITPARLVDAFGKVLRSGAKPETRAVDESSGAPSIDRETTFAAVPAGKYKLVFGPFLVFSESVPTTIEIPAATFRKTALITGRAEQPAVKTLIPFNVGGGQYAVTEIELADRFTGFYFEPKDTVAASILPLGTSEPPVLIDDTGRSYQPEYRSAKGRRANGGMEVDHQYMRYFGTPSAEVETLSLVLGGYDEVVEGEWTIPVTVEEKR